MLTGRAGVTEYRLAISGSGVATATTAADVATEALSSGPVAGCSPMPGGLAAAMAVTAAVVNRLPLTGTRSAKAGRETGRGWAEPMAASASAAAPTEVVRVTRPVCASTRFGASLWATAVLDGLAPRPPLLTADRSAVEASPTPALGSAAPTDTDTDAESVSMLSAVATPIDWDPATDNPNTNAAAPARTPPPNTDTAHPLSHP